MTSKEDPRRTGELLRQALTWEPLDEVFIVDSHVHVGEMPPFYQPAPWYEWPGILELMDLLGIDMSCINSLTHVDLHLGNQIVAEACNAHPDRFIGYGTVTPLEPDRIVPELEWCADHYDMRGIKLHPYSAEYPADGPNHFPVYGYAEEHDLPVLIDVNHRQYNYEGLIRAAERYPNVQFIMPHYGGSLKATRETCTACPNVAVDMTYTVLGYDYIERLVDICGAERVLFGSDIHVSAPESRLGYIIGARISDREKRMILGENIARLCKIEIPERYSTS